MLAKQFTILDRSSIMVNMNRKSVQQRAFILQLLVEGNSLRAASRIADVSINTVYKLLVEIGEVCDNYQDLAFRNLPCRTIQVDEIWSFVYAKHKNVTDDKVWNLEDLVKMADSYFTENSK